MISMFALTKYEDKEIRDSQVEEIVISGCVHGFVFSYHHTCHNVPQNSGYENDEVTDADGKND